MERAVNPLISIIVPIYNAEKYIDRCVESIVKQTYKNIEVLLIDDGSSDNSLKMCEEWSKKDSRVKTYHQENGGVSSARNKGLDNAKGEYVSFVDADDWIEERYCEDMLNTLEENEADYITCGYNRVYADGHSELFNGDGSITIVDAKAYIDGILDVLPAYGFVHMKLVKREFIGDLRFDKNLKAAEDALFSAELVNKLNKIVIFNKPLYNYFFNENSIVRRYDENYVNKYYDSMKAMYDYIGSGNKKVYSYIAFHVLLICVNYCYHPKNENQKKSLIEVCNIPLFKESIKKTKGDNWSIFRKVTLYTLKFKLYFMTAMICKFRQRQFKK